MYESHKDFPLAPNKREITFEMIEGKVVDYLEGNGQVYRNQIRLLQDFLPKEKYVIHIEVLKFYLEQGLILRGIHRAVKFFQSNWMAGYINMNTEKRAQATNDFDKDFRKLMVRNFSIVLYPDVQIFIVLLLLKIHLEIPV